MAIASNRRLCVAIFGISAAFAAFAGMLCVRDSSHADAPPRRLAAALISCDAADAPETVEHLPSHRFYRNAARGVPRTWRALSRRSAPNALAPLRELAAPHRPVRLFSRRTAPQSAPLAVLKHSRPVRAGPILL